MYSVITMHNSIEASADKQSNFGSRPQSSALKNLENDGWEGFKTSPSNDFTGI